ncbi:DUF4251 domain-containing protein [Bacteroides sp. 519]|uniref:DUF4251 domain-containing protein n=1 Tax=Bacteroides sp. 519 TaxID=2302937 RepID=UPI0013D81042|nr:DUF4251 domain-containing protein [Bacteroides sp. 519]NDV59533.1 DUF4251 domain-containing protein [Bacteroides sp. 519]
MKKNHAILLIFLVIITLTGISCATSQKNGNNEEAKLLLKELIDKGEYSIEATMAYPRRGKSISLTSSYSLKIKNDSVFSYLPFYGRAYNIPYGGGNGLNFTAPVENYLVKYNKKGDATINFNAKTSEDTYKYTINIYPNGSSNIDVIMQQRESMRYSGRLDQ